MVYNNFTGTVQATNASGQAIGTLKITFTPAAPAYLGTFSDQEAIVGVPFSYETAPHFAGENLVFSATGLPEGFSIDPESGRSAACRQHDGLKNAGTCHRVR